MATDGGWFLEQRAGPALPGPAVVLRDGLEIGRAVDPGLLLADPTVSRVHARLQCLNGRWQVVDLASLGGTFVNGHRIAPQVGFPLLPRDRLRIGPWQFEVRDRARAGPGRNAVPGESARVTRIAHRRDARLDWLLTLLTEIDTHRAGWADRWLQRLVAMENFERAWLVRRDTPEPEAIGAAPADTPLDAGALIVLANLALDELAVIEHDAHQYLATPVGADAALLVAIAAAADADRVGLLLDDAARVAGLVLAQAERSTMGERLAALDHELGQARGVQRRILPAPHGDVAQVRYAFDWRPGRVVGGDWVDVFALDAQRAVIALGDVAGSGIAAALLMGALQAYLRAAVTAYGDLVLAVRAANAWLLAHAGGGRFATLWIGVFDARSHSVTAVDAGHGFAFLHRGGRLERVQFRGAVPLGVDSAASFAPEVIHLREDERIVLLSDGVAEALAPAGDAALDKALARALTGSDSPTRDRERLVDALLAGGEAPSDDATLLSVGWI